MTSPKRKKGLSIADRIRQSAEQNISQTELDQEKASLQSVLHSDRVRSGSGQDQVDTGSRLYSYKGDTVSPKGQVRNISGSGQEQVSSSRSRSGQGQVSSIEYRSGQVQVDPHLNFSTNEPFEYVLAPQQQKIYTWFLKNGLSGYFNKGQIQRDTGVNHPTIRKIISKFVAMELIQISDYNPVSRQQKYVINTQKKVTLLQRSGQGQGSGNISGSGQGQVSGIRSGSGQGQVSTKDTAFIEKERKISVFLENSDFWQTHGVTIVKCQEWMDELKLSSEFLNIQLQYGEIANEVRNANNPRNYFYRCLQKGGLAKPEGFEFPEERRMRLEQEALEVRKRALEKLRKHEDEQAQIELEENFEEIVTDPDQVDLLISSIEQGFVTPKKQLSIKKYRETGNISATLKIALRNEFMREEGG